MIGYVDFAQLDLVSGWAYDPDNPTATVILEVLVDGGVVGRTAANRRRPDVKRAGFGDGRVGFIFEFARTLSPDAAHEVEVRVAATGETLHNSPVRLAPVWRVTDASRVGFEAAVATLAGTGARSRVLDRLVDAAERLRLMRDARNQPGSRLRAGGRPLALAVSDRASDPSGVAWMASLQRLGFRVVRTHLADADSTGSPDLRLPAGVELLTREEFTSTEDVLRHFANEAALVHLHGGETMRRYGALTRSRCGAARLVYSPHDDDPTGGAAIMARWADVVLTTREDAAAALRRSTAGLDVRCIPPELAPAALDDALRGVVGSSKAPLVAPRPPPSPPRRASPRPRPRRSARAPDARPTG